MTCIVGLVHNGVTYIGADSLGSNDYRKLTRNDKKVFKLKDTPNAIIGFASSFRMGQLLMYATGLIDPKDEPNINHEYIVTKFIPNVIYLFEDGGFLRNHSGEKYGGTFLLGYKDKLFMIGEDYQVCEPFNNYIACGSGEAFALGSLMTTENMNLNPYERIRLALQAATKFAIGVEPPFYIINTKDDEVVEYKY
jgi:ATP-dependent protease HslVU (ClpYQ) peptidase subunit